MRLEDAERMARDAIAEHGLHYGGWRFAWNRRTGAAGLCNYRKRTVELSRLLTPHRSEEDVRDTVLHEVAHALVGAGYGHGPVWKRKAVEVGARPRACVADVAACAVVRRYRAVCPACGPLLATRQKRTTRSYRHNACGSAITWEVQG